jgi:hypothetical protein
VIVSLDGAKMPHRMRNLWRQLFCNFLDGYLFSCQFFCIFLKRGAKIMVFRFLQNNRSLL